MTQNGYGDKVRFRYSFGAITKKSDYCLAKPQRLAPDLNPIEMAFAKLKALLRKAAERTVAGLWTKIGELLAEFSEGECANYFRHAGYA